jgi:RsiW-degrading membrane proteinase PrsW (M82 family)
MLNIETVGGAIAGSLLIALAWLWFWLREDSAHPEPRKLIALAFLGGMITVAVVIPIQEFVQGYIVTQTLLFTAWSGIEEVCKYISARVTVLWRREDDEPIDPVIYMVTTALGFSAVENALFLLSPLAGGTLLSTIETGDLRFVGATLVHVLSSGLVGIALAFTFYQSKWIRRFAAFIGVILATVLHSTFNFFILNATPDETIRVLLFVWIGVIVLLAVLEWIKRIAPKLSAK